MCLGGAGRNQRGQSRQRTTYANKTLRSETLYPLSTVYLGKWKGNSFPGDVRTLKGPAN